LGFKREIGASILRLMCRINVWITATGWQPHCS